ncbi:cupin domain-containing protein [Hydrogenophaga soli]
MSNQIGSMGRWVMAMAVGGVLTVAGTQVLDAARYVRALPLQTPAVAQPMPLQPLADAPATVQAGRPAFRAAHYTDSPGRHSGSGIWACDGPSTFEWHFEADEVVYLLEGEVQVTYRGQQFTIHPGETAVFHQGNSAVWHVPERVKKSYTLHHPPLLVRLWRRWVG